MTNTTNRVDDAIVRRLYARGKWKLESVAHFGGDETYKADMPLLLDAEGKPFIPGPSVAGAARNFLAQQRKPWTEYKDGIESSDLKNFFGGAKECDTMSSLIVADANCICKQVKTSLRDGVRVNAKSGSAADKAKFDVEVVERGTEFELVLECIIRATDDSDELKDLFLALLHAFQQGDIRLGARTRRGYGRGKVASWEIGSLQMRNPQDVLAWLRGDFWCHTEQDLTPSPLSSDERQYLCIEADFNLRTSLLIRSSSEDPTAPDMTHLLSNGKPVVPGTSFAGAFRHRSSLIANVLNWHQESEDKDAVCEIFGPVHEQEREDSQSESKPSETEENTLWASRVVIEERLVKRVKLQWQDRVAIDRFTGGSLQNALFNEKPVYPRSLKEMDKKQAKPNLRLRLTLEEPEEAEIGLLLLTLRDFWHGRAALGGETSIGRGTLEGIKARLKLKRSDASEVKVWKFLHQDKRMTLDEGDQEFLESCVEQAQNYSNRPAGSRRPKKEKEIRDV